MASKRSYTQLAGPASIKKSTLTLAKLASYDDLITDVLIDHVYYWSTIRKNKPRYSVSRGIGDELIPSLIRKTIVLDRSIPAAIDLLITTVPPIRNFLARLATQLEKEDFIKHMKKYLSLYMPDCKFEVCTTNRYTITTYEAAIRARKPISKNETIKYLDGTLVPLTEKEEQMLDCTCKDFSIVTSARKKTSSIFLGPARFANHDCDANAVLRVQGSQGMSVVAVREIQVDEEITVSYGDSYFGEGNLECLCGTCEREERNGWASGRAKDEKSDDDGLTTRLAKRRKRRTPGAQDGHSIRAVTLDKLPTRTRRKLIRSASSAPVVLGLEPSVTETPKSGTPDEGFARLVPQVPDFANIETDLLPFLSASPTSCHSDNASASSCPSVALPLPQRMRRYRLGERSSRAQSRSASTSGLEDQLQLTEATSVESDLEERPVEQNIQQEESVSEQTKSPEDGDPDDYSTGPRTNLPLTSPVPGVQELGYRQNDERSHSDMPVPTIEKISCAEPFANGRSGDLEKTKSPTEPVERAPSPVPLQPKSPSPPSSAVRRRPGDYTLARALLAFPCARWVTCLSCAGHFVQTDSPALTRRACPRCERHSKLYGFEWPKVEPERGDREARVLDHRTINRFL